MTLLSKPWKVDAEGERIYVYAPGEVCIDICSGRPEDRARALALLAQAPKMAHILKALCEDRGINKVDVEAVLRDAGVMSDDDCMVGP